MPPERWRAVNAVAVNVYYVKYSELKNARNTAGIHLSRNRSVPGQLDLHHLPQKRIGHGQSDEIFLEVQTLVIGLEELSFQIECHLSIEAV